MKNKSKLTDETANIGKVVLVAVELKSKSRIKGYKEGTDDFNAQFNMLLDDGVTCSDCRHSIRCEMIYGGDNKNTSCQFYPNKFLP